jgi:hypothetical protein
MDSLGRNTLPHADVADAFESNGLERQLNFDRIAVVRQFAGAIPDEVRFKFFG